MTTIYHGKKPLMRGKATPFFVKRLKSIIETLKATAPESANESSQKTTKKTYSHKGLTAIIEHYYDERTYTLEGAGIIHYGMGENDSYFDIDITKLIEAEKKLGIEVKRKKVA